MHINFSRISIIMLFLSFSANIFGQKNPETLKLLKSAADKAIAYKTIHTKFNFLVENTQEETKETYDGEFWVKGKKFKMIVDKTVTFSDGKTRWVYLPDQEEVTVTNVQKVDDLDPEERFLNEPLSLFTLYESGFKYVTEGTQKIDGKNYTLVDLSPEDISKPFFKIRVWISDNFDYYGVKYFQKDGTRITLHLTEFQHDEKLKDDLFEYSIKDNPDVEVIDLRK